MNLNNIIDEIGIFETYKKIENNIYNDSLIFNISKYIPISSDNFKLQSVIDVTNKIINLQKRNVMFLSNEISILEELLKYKNCFDNIIVVLSNSLSKKQKKIL